MLTVPMDGPPLHGWLEQTGALTLKAYLEAIMRTARRPLAIVSLAFLSPFLTFIQSRPALADTPGTWEDKLLPPEARLQLLTRIYPQPAGGTSIWSPVHPVAGRISSPGWPDCPPRRAHGRGSFREAGQVCRHWACSYEGSSHREASRNGKSATWRECRGDARGAWRPGL
jgi:hypothetical protein